MNRDSLIWIAVVVAAVIIAAWAIIPAFGLAFAIAKGLIQVPPILADGSISVLVIGGGLGAAAGAVGAVKLVEKKRQSTFVALCSCGEWFISDSIAELYLENHPELDKILFRAAASIAFVLAAGLWVKKDWRVRVLAAALFLAPSGLFAWKVYLGEVRTQLSGWQLYSTVALPVLLAAFFVFLYSKGWIKDE